MTGDQATLPQFASPAFAAATGLGGAAVNEILRPAPTPKWADHPLDALA
ncbi:hypothetical protein ACIOJE_27720 [Kitasatospora sp. NPDC087861]